VKAVKRKRASQRSFFLIECFKTPRDAATTLFAALSIILYASCLVPLVFLSDQIVVAYTRGEPLDLFFTYILILLAFSRLISLFTSVFQQTLTGNVFYRKIKNLLESVSPKLLRDKDFSFKEIYRGLEMRTELRSRCFFEFLQGLFGAAFLGLAISYFAPWAVLVLIVGSLLAFYFTAPLAVAHEYQGQGSTLQVSPDWLFEAEHYGAKEFFFGEIKKLYAEENQRSAKFQMVINFLASSGRVIEAGAFLLSLGMSTYYLAQAQATSGSVLIVLIFGRSLQKHLGQILTSIKQVLRRDNFEQKTVETVLKFKEEVDLDSFLESQIRDKFELEEDVNLCLEVAKVSFSVPGGGEVQNFSLSVLAGEKVQVVSSRAEQMALLEILLGIKRPESGGVSYVDVDQGTISRLRALRQMAYLSVPELQTKSWGLTVREQVGFGDITKVNDDGRILELLIKAGILASSERSERLLDRLTPHGGVEEKKLLHLRALFGGRRFFLVDGSTFDWQVDASLLTEIVQDPRSTVLFFTRERLPLEGFTRVVDLADYTV
jgi:hypothetical protein